MQKLNHQATRIFCRILNKMKDGQYLKLNVAEFMPLTIERIADNVTTPWGAGALYSLCYYYEQNGDLMRDPEMCFLVVDNRRQAKEYDAIAIYPQQYLQDNTGTEEESIRIESGKLTTYLKTWQSGYCSFTNLWLLNIRQQGFLNG